MNKLYTTGNAGNLLHLSSTSNVLSGSSPLTIHNSPQAIHHSKSIPLTIINHPSPLNCTSMNTDTTKTSTMHNFFTVNYRRFAGNAVAKILMGVVLMMVGQVGIGQVLLSDDFSYTTPGNLQTAASPNWAAHSGTSNFLQYTNTGLTFTGHAGSGVGGAVSISSTGVADHNRSFTSQSSGVVYMSCLVNFSAATTTDYFLHFNTTTFNARVLAINNAGNLRFGVSKAGTPAAAATNFSFGTTYLLVVKYTFNTGTTTDDQVDLWVLPSFSSTEAGAGAALQTTTAGTDATALNAVAIRQGNPPTGSIDAVRAGTTWSSVAPAATPTVNLSVSSNSSSETSPTAITVTATASAAVTGNQTVSLGVSGTNITAGDYTLSSGTITILSGQTTGTATFTVVDDALVESTETAVLTISSPSSGITLGATTTQNITITDNDVPAFPTVALSVSSTTATETSPAAITVTATASSVVSGDQTVNLAVSGTNITAGDYSLSAGSITILSGQTTGTATFTIVDDALIEGTETATLTISNPSAGILLGSPSTQNITITDNDFPAVNLSVSTSTATEAAATVVTVTATASQAVVGAQTVAIAVTGTGITAGDYTLSNSTITIASGQTTGTVTFTVVNDVLAEGTETAILTISTPSAGVLLGATTTQNITITDNDVATPNATAATSVTTNSFTSNWDAAIGASSYRLDVSTSNTFGSTQTIASEGFENALSLFSETTGTGTFYSGNSGAGDLPVSSPLVAAGTYGYGKQNGSVTITSNDINTSSYSNTQMNFRLAAFSNPTGNGLDVGDIVTVSVSTDGGATYLSTIRVLGRSNAYWAYSASGNASTPYDGNATPVDLQATSGGSNADGYSTVTITGLPSVTNLRIRINLFNDNAAERWIIDDFKVIGFLPVYVLGYQDLTISGISQPVTGLSPNTTYYYRVRATDGSITTANSNTITVTTLPVPVANADFRSQTNGNFSTAATWQYNQGGNSWITATAAPVSTNNVNIFHEVTLNQNFTVGAGKSLIINSTPTAGSLIISPTSNLGMTDATSTINFNGQPVTVKSDATGTGSIGQMFSPFIANATNVTIERFIPANSNRAWRLLAIPASGQTIKQAWQENQAPLAVGTPNLGTQITANFGNLTNVQTLGFDDFTPNNSMLKYVPATATTTEALSGVSNTSNLIANEPGYFIYIRGDRSKTKSSATSDFNETTLKTTGSIKSGDQVTTALLPQIRLIGNPFASAIDLRNIAIANGFTGTTFRIWDPKLSTVGAYQTLTLATSGVNAGQYTINPGGGSYGLPGSVVNTIQSGQAFFATATAPGTITISEASKATGSALVFRPSSPAAGDQRFFANLNSVSSSGERILDGVYISLDDNHDNAINNFDSRKQNNFTENLSMRKEGVKLTVEKRKAFANNDTIFFNIASMRQTSYALFFKADNLDANLVATLEDTYLNTKTLVNPNGNSTYNFTVDANAGSSAANRFRIVFKELGSGPLPVTFTNIKAAEQGNNVAVEWKVGEQINIAGYTVEKSVNGRSFSPLGTVTATALKVYNWLDVTPVQGNNYYRVRANDINGVVKYTQIVKITLGRKGSAIAVSPNPVQGNTVNLQFTNQAAGKYQVNLINSTGQLMYSNILQHAGGSSSQAFTLSSQIIRGVYQLEIVAPDKTRKAQKLIVE